jgi:hypothetical protein
MALPQPRSSHNLGGHGLQLKKLDRWGTPQVFCQRVRCPRVQCPAVFPWLADVEHMGGASRDTIQTGYWFDGYVQSWPATYLELPI